MRSRPRRWPRVLAGTVSAFVLVLTGMSGVGAVVYRNLDSNITAKEMTNVISTADPSGSATASSTPDSFEPGEPLNILVLGSDTRAGTQNAQYGSEQEIEGARNDTTILVHIAADRKSAIAVSIPRDTEVNIPACPRYLLEPSPAKTDRINEAFRVGGPACTSKTVEALTGIPMDHMIVVDFAGFKDVVESLGGVEVCLKEPVDDPLSGLKLPAGNSVVKGEEALAFVRARYTLGDGSDIGRIERQQAFLASAIRKATSLGVLGNPIQTYRVLDNVTKSLTTDPGLSSLDRLSELALSLSDMTPSDITFLTMPFRYNDDGATVAPDPNLTAVLWQTIESDGAWPPAATVPEGQTTAMTVAPASISVTVLNGTGRDGAATKASEALTKMDYKVVETGDYTGTTPTTTEVRYPPGYSEQARTLAYATGAKKVIEDHELEGTTSIQLIAGSDFSTVKPVIVATPASASPSASTAPGGTDSTDPNSQKVDGTSADTVVCS
ncbi:MAG: hypothetical protein RLZ55_1489 [Actinomycetota bacterium]